MPTNKKTNMLIDEKSPYLLQHAYNPVNWYPWGEEAFEKAKRENKPLFVSIGYSTCHWCHVMEHESFEDEEVAKLINDRFVAIKVDREERPDIDSIYMRVCQMMTGQGGWPLNVFLTPDQKPFYAGTYFPKESRFNRPGLQDVVVQLYDAFTNDPKRITGITEQITEALQQKAALTSNQLDISVLHQTFEQLATSFDSIYGGFGTAPKFPIPHMLTFLYRYHLLTGNEQALHLAKKTLDGMANGGIYDHIGGGFARYSTDQEWLVPHFEKMLYDNALLLHAYAEGYQLLHDERYAQIVDEIITFVKRELTDVDGAFYSALDADSDGVEGKYYVWTKEEILQLLGDEMGELVAEVYDITELGNFEGENIPNLIHTNWERIERFGFSKEELDEKLTAAKETLLLERSTRVYPHCDDKILTAWNALFISGLAKAAQVFQKQEYVDVAKRALQFIEDRLIIDGRVMVRFRDGEVKNKGYIDDYAFLLWAYIEMYEATFDLLYIERAKKIADDMNVLFWDEEQGGFFFYGNDGENLLVRDKEVYDGAIPSGNGVAAVQFMRLSSITGEDAYSRQVEKMFVAFSEVGQYGNGHTQFLQGLLLTALPRKEIVIVGEQSDEDVQSLLRTLQQSFLPQYSVLVFDSSEQIVNIAANVMQYKKIDDKPTVYICENFACKQPTTSIDEVLSILIKK
ncbi:thioredoxin domain-containing protein [Ectobacillus sp. sgz5001026]|uniref:thioredoxin domain-containing protein n=1 Tax=Ectobacillus sp. sgz5001026 TaxID=3242473 RepID=UPI0036D32CCE